jgi:hypothetical protein
MPTNNRDVVQSTAPRLASKVLSGRLYPTTLAASGTVISVTALSAPVPLVLSLSAQVVAVLYAVALLGLIFRTE